MSISSDFLFIQVTCYVFNGLKKFTFLFKKRCQMQSTNMQKKNPTKKILLEDVYVYISRYSQVG